MASLVSTEQGMAFVLVAVFLQSFVHHHHHLCSAASLPTSVVLPGTVACDAKNPDPCSNFPGLCTTGGGLCVYKGPCEYECVCPPDGRRGRDCTGGDDGPSAQGEEENESSRRASPINSLLVFPQDLFWDLNQVLRPEESVKMMQSTPADVLQPRAVTTSSPTTLPDRLSSTVTASSKSEEQSSVSSSYATTQSAVATETTSNNEYTQSLRRNDDGEGGESKYSKNMEEMTTRMQTTPSSLLSTSTLLSRLITIIDLQNTTVSPTLSSNPTSSIDTEKDRRNEGAGPTIGYTTSKFDREEDTEDTATTAASPETTTTLTTTKATTPGISQTSNASTTISAHVSGQPQISTTTKPGTVSPTPEQPQTTTNSVKDDDSSTTTPVSPTYSVRESTTTSAPKSTTKQIITTSPASRTNDKSTATSTTLTTTKRRSFPTQPNIPDRFPGHETFPTFFRDVFDDANGEGENRNAEMSKRVQRVFFPLPGFETIRREED